MELACPPADPGLVPATAPPTISVVIAAYQAADCIGDALGSALEQTVAALEVVVCDDGSTDDLHGALAPFADRISLIRQPNRGEAAAKNSAIRAASGEFVAVLDADDAYLPERLERLGALAVERPDLDILTTDAYLEVNGKPVRRVYGPAWRFETADQRAEILRRNFIFGHVAVRRELLLAAGGFDESIRHTTDWECWIRLILDGARAGAVLEPLARYRVRRQSLSTDRAAMLEGGIESLRRGLAHPRITARERDVAAATIASRQRELAPLRLERLLARPGRGTRRGALALAADPEVPVRTRLKSLAAAAWPRVVSRVLARRRRRLGWVGAGGTRVEHD